MRRAEIYYKNIVAVILSESNEGQYTFQYDKEYVVKNPDRFIAFSMPVTERPYRENKLFPFFEGLIPEGWLLNIVALNFSEQKQHLIYPILNKIML